MKKQLYRVVALSLCLLMLLQAGSMLFETAPIGASADVEETGSNSHAPEGVTGSTRLLVKSSDSEAMAEDAHASFGFGDVWLLSYDTEDEAAEAYSYYQGIADFVEYDLLIGGNSFNADAFFYLHELLGDEETAYDELEECHVAVIDTGSADAVSIVSGNGNDNNGHGTTMIEAMNGVDPDISVLSIKAFDEQGTGSFASVYAGLWYAIKMGARAIVLPSGIPDSMAAKHVVSIAQELGIPVVCPAGGSGIVANTAMGIYTVGACDNMGVVQDAAGYDGGIPYYVAARTADEAAGIFGALIGAYGIEYIDVALNNGIVFDGGYVEKQEDIVDELSMEEGVPVSVEEAIKDITENDTSISENSIADEEFFDEEETDEEEIIIDEETIDEEEIIEEDVLDEDEIIDKNEIVDEDEGTLNSDLDSDNAENVIDEPMAVAFSNDIQVSGLDDSIHNTADGALTVGSVTLDYVLIHWLTVDSITEQPANFDTLHLRPDTEIAQDQQFQIDISTSGRDPYKPGDIEITLPASIWTNRYGSVEGNLTLAVPEYPETSGTFNWEYDPETDRIIIRNTKNIPASGKIMLQGSFRNVNATNIVDNTQSGGIEAIVTIQTPEGEPLTMQSNIIDAFMDTHIEAVYARKTAENTVEKNYDVFWGDEAPLDYIPEELLPAGEGAGKPSNYAYVRWYVAGAAGGSQPFRMYIEDTVDDGHGGVLLGMSHTIADPSDPGVKLSSNGVYYKKAENNHIRALVYDGYSVLPKTAYIWVAYKKEDFLEKYGMEPQTIENAQTVHVEGIDGLDGETTVSDTGTVVTKYPTTYRFVKFWDDHSNREGHRPSYLNLYIYRNKISEYDSPWHYEKVTEAHQLAEGSEGYWVELLKDANIFTDEMLDDGSVNASYSDFWVYEWSDGGNEAAFSVKETLPYYWGNIGDTMYNEDNTAQNQWSYTQRYSDFHAPINSWVYVNAYYEGLRTLPLTYMEKIRKSPWHDNERISTADNYVINRLLRGETIYIGYDVFGRLSVADKYVQLNGNLPNIKYVMEDTRFSMKCMDYMVDGLTFDDFDIGALNFESIYLYNWGNTVEGPNTDSSWYERDRLPADAVPILEIQGLNNGSWVTYATWDNVARKMTAVTGTGARTTSDTRVIFPKGTERVRIQFEDNVALVECWFDVELRLSPTPNMLKTIEELFELNLSPDVYHLFPITNYVETYAEYADEGSVTAKNNKGVQMTYERGDRFSEDTYYSVAQSTGYAHGKYYKVAADLTKDFDMTHNDTVNKRVILHSTLEYTQQSNITAAIPHTTAREDNYMDEQYLHVYTESLDAGDIPNTERGWYYDLLPKGVDFEDGTVKVSDSDTLLNQRVIPNYKGTGRTLLIFEVLFGRNIGYTDPDISLSSYDNVSAKYPDEGTYPVEGYKSYHTLEFDTAISHEMLLDSTVNINQLRNLAAFEALEEVGNVTGWKGEPDDPTAGMNNLSSRNVYPDAELMTDLDTKRADDETYFVYAGATVKNNFPDVMAMTTIVKQVTAPGVGGMWGTGRDVEDDIIVNVPEGGIYTYRLKVGNDAATRTSNLLVMDRIEQYVPTPEEENSLDKGMWYGSLISVDVSSAEAMGIKPVVWYSTKQGIDPSIYIDLVSNEIMSAEEVLDVFKDSPDWTQTPERMSDVTAVAFDLSKTQDGKDFILKESENVSLYLYMRAPYDEPFDEIPYYFNGTDGSDPLLNAHAFNGMYVGGSQTATIGGMVHGSGKDFFVHNPYTKVGIYSKNAKVEKVWWDDDDRDGLRPGSIEVELYRNGKATGQTVVLNESNNWMGEVKRLAMYDDDGNEYEYSFVEKFDTRDEYDLDLSIVSEGTANFKITLYNKHDPELISIPVEKFWDDEGNESARPVSILFHLWSDDNEDGEMRDTGITITVEPDDEGLWRGEFTGLFKYHKNGTPVKYEVVEEPMEGYKQTGKTGSEDDPEAGFTFTNWYDPKGDLHIYKTVRNSTDVTRENSVFTFALALTMDGNDISEKYAYKVFDADGNEAKPIDSKGNILGTTYDEDDNPMPPEFDVEQKIGSRDNFYLKDGWHIEIYDMPLRVEYTVEERTDAWYTLTGQIGSYGKIISWEPAIAEFTNTYNTSGSLQIDALKHLNGQTLLPSLFRFDLIDMATGSIIPAFNREDGSVKFRALKFGNEDDGKTYRYKLVEYDTGLDYYDYDGTIYYVDITVHDNGDGTMSFDVQYYDEEENPMGPGDVPVFVNDYYASGKLTLPGWKTIDGRDLEDGDVFDFVLYNQHFEKVGQTRNDENGSIEFEVEFDQDDIGNTYWFYARELEGSDDGDIIYGHDIIGYKVTVFDNGDGTLQFDESSYIMTGAFTECGACKGKGTVNGSACAVCKGFGYTAVQCDECGGSGCDTCNGFGITWDSEFVPSRGAVFTNTLKPGKLSVTKEVDSAGSAIPNNSVFNFIVRLLTNKLADGDTIYGTVGSKKTGYAVTEIDGEMFEFSFILKGGETITFEGIPAGAVYQISEDTPEGWIIYNQEGVSGTIVSMEEAVAKVLNRYQPDASSVTVTGTKFFNNSPANTDNEGNVFQFVLVNKKTKEETVVDVLPGGLILFNMTYEQPGTYEYTLKEIVGNNDGVMYDSHEVDVTVTVVKDKKTGNLTATMECDGETSFQNYSTPGGLEISKEADGLSDQNKDALFHFKISFSNENGIPLSGQIFPWYVKDTATGKIVSRGNSAVGGAEQEEPGKVKAFFNMLMSPVAKLVAAFSDDGDGVPHNVMTHEEYVAGMPDPDTESIEAYLNAGNPEIVHTQPNNPGNGKDKVIAGYTIIKTDRWVQLPDGREVQEYVMKLEEERDTDLPTMLRSRGGENGVPDYAAVNKYHPADDTNNPFGDEVTAILIEGTVYMAGYNHVIDDGDNNNNCAFRGFANLVYADMRNLDPRRQYKSGSSFRMFADDENLTTVLFDKNKPFKGTHKLYEMFARDKNLKTVEGLAMELERGTGGHLNAFEINNLFDGCSSLEHIDISGWKFKPHVTINGIVIQNLFRGCTSLKTVDMSGWEFENPIKEGYTINFNNIFNGCTSLESVDMSGWSFKDVKGTLANINTVFKTNCTVDYVDMSGWTFEGTNPNISLQNMFNKDVKVKSVDMSDMTFNSEMNVNMSGMFAGSASVEEVDMSGIRFGMGAGHSVDMSLMFNNAMNLKNTNLSGIKLICDDADMHGLFYNCTSLGSVDVNTWSHDNEAIDMQEMFWGCENLSGINGLESLVTGNVTNIKGMFGGCLSIERLDLSAWDVSNVARAQGFIAGCSDLKSLNVRNWDTSGITDGALIFSNFDGYKQWGIEEVTIDNGFYTYNSNMAAFPDPSSSSPYTGKWILKDQVNMEKPTQVFTSQELKDGLLKMNAGDGTYVWQKASYKVSFKSGLPAGGSDGSMITVASPADEDFILPENKFEPIGQYAGSRIFAGWHDEENGYDFYLTSTPEGELICTIPGYTYGAGTGTVTLTAIWMEVDEDGRVTYYKDIYLQDINSLDKYTFVEAIPAKAEFGDILDRIEAPGDRAGFVTPSDATGVEILSYTVTRVPFLYDRVSYTIHFDGNTADGGFMDDMTVISGVSVQLGNGFTKENSAFLGWNTSMDGAGAQFGAQSAVKFPSILWYEPEPGSTITLYAQWMTADDSITATDGYIIVSCKAGQTIVLDNLPAGTVYEIEEIDLPNGWSQDGEIEGYGGSIKSNEISEAHARNTYHAVGNIYLEAHKKLEMGMPNEGEFEFELSDSPDFTRILSTSRNGAADTSIGGYTGTGEYEPNIWYGAASVLFDSITFTEPGTYTYYIRERHPGNDPDGRYEPHIVYDEHVETVQVIVTDNGDGTLSCRVVNGGALFINKSALDSPATGGNGIIWLCVEGLLLTLAGIYMLWYKKKAVTE